MIMDNQTFGVYNGRMDEFTITEAAFRAVIEGYSTAYQAIAVLEARIDALNEAYVIQGHRLDHVEDALRSLTLA